MRHLLDQHLNLRPFGARNICLAHSCPNISLVSPFYEQGLKLLDEDFTATHSGRSPAARSLNCNMGTWGNQEKATHGGHTTLPAKLCSSHVSNTHKGGVLSETSRSADVLFMHQLSYGYSLIVIGIGVNLHLTSKHIKEIRWYIYTLKHTFDTILLRRLGVILFYFSYY